MPFNANCPGCGSTNPYGCNDPCNDITASNDVKYTGPNLPGTGILTCDTLTVALQKIDNAIVNLQSGILPTTTTTSTSTSTTTSTSTSTSTTTSTTTSIPTTTTTTTMEVLYTFDVTANWSLIPGVTDEATFISYLESGIDGTGNLNSLTGVSVTDFSLVGGRLRCNLLATGTSIYLSNISATEVRGVGNITGLEQIWLELNIINLFDPSLPLPSSLLAIFLNQNQIVTFNPSIALPASLINLELNGNQIVTFDPTIPLPNSLEYLSISDNDIVTFNPSLPLPNSLIYLNLWSNDIVTFNPTIPLPNSLQELDISSNQMTTAGYTGSEPWANAMTTIPARGFILIGGNFNSASGTNLETILTSKGWTVTV